MFRCKSHSNSMDGFNGTASCLECGEMIYAGLKLCDRCSKYLDKCEICCDAADETDINPALVSAFSSPEGQAARKLAKTGRELQNQSYCDSLSGIYQSLVEPAQKRLARATEPLRQKLGEALEADPVYQAALAEVTRLTALPWNDETRRLSTPANNALSAARRPHDEAFRLEQGPLIEAYNAEIAPYKSVHKALWDSLQTSTQAIIDGAEATLAQIIKDARAAKK